MFPTWKAGRNPSPISLQHCGPHGWHSDTALPGALSFFLLLRLRFLAGLIHGLSVFPFLRRNFLLTLDSELCRTKGRSLRGKARGPGALEQRTRGCSPTKRMLFYLNPPPES